MTRTKTVEEWRTTLQPALESKVNELQLMGYTQATKENVWNCLMKKVWRGNPTKRLHEVVQDIFHLSSNIYMSYLTVDTYQETQNDDIMASIAALTNNDDETT
ncbi:post-transcriptional regulator [Oceanobacillus halotolerans]|uniref:post-transcriptional regulator n=1 Tax=Oceanobacillus halotolerans TaxID=2663380 RepID=UPI0013DD59F6|nr:post-transcriptional regulator [Oceanobacillus halotolerans]